MYSFLSYCFYYVILNNKYTPKVENSFKKYNKNKKLIHNHMNTDNLLEVNNLFINSTQLLWGNLITFLPKLTFAVLFLVIGLILASLLGRLVTRIAIKLKLDKILTTIGLASKIKASGINVSISSSLGWIIKWFIIIAVLLTISDMLSLTTVSLFLTQVLLYIPNVLIAIIILTIGLVVGNFISELVGKSISTSDFISPASVKLLTLSTRWIIITFAAMAALSQLNIAPELIQVLFSGIIMMFALAGGLAFGLGGKEKAQEFINNILANK